MMTELEPAIEEQFNQACQSGSLRKLQAIAKQLAPSRVCSDQLYNFVNMGLLTACIHNQLEIVDFIFQSADIKKINPRLFHASNGQHIANEALISAASDGHLRIVEYLLTSTAMPFNADIHANNDKALRRACSAGHLHMVKYLLTSPLLKEHADLHVYNECPLRDAAQGGHVDIVHYLLTAPEIVQAGHTWADVHAYDDEIIDHACKRQDPDLLNYLVFEYKMKETPEINDLSKKYPALKSSLEYRNMQDTVEDAGKPSAPRSKL